MKNKQELFTLLETKKDLIVELQKNLTSIPAINPENQGDGEYNKFVFLKNFLSQWNFDAIDELYAPDERVSSKIRPSLIATINGDNQNKNLWIITHLDVVPPGDRDLWNTDPYKIEVIDDKIYGRGTEDNQQSLVSSLVAAKILLESNITPAYNVKLLFVADEEVGSHYGIEWILKNTDIFNKNDLILTPDVGDPEGNFIEIAEKSVLWITFNITGKQSHGSRPDLGINAATACSHFCVRMEKLRETFNATDELFDLPYSTFEPTMRVNPITNMNTIPGQESIGFDCRVLPVYNLDDIINEMENIAHSVEKDFDVTIRYDIKQKVQATAPTPVDSEVVTKLKKSIKDVLDKDAQPIGIGGGTVAAYFRMYGYHAALWSTVDNTMHCPNEYSKISNTLTDAKVFLDLMLG